MDHKMPSATLGMGDSCDAPGTQLLPKTYRKGWRVAEAASHLFDFLVKLQPEGRKRRRGQVPVLLPTFTFVSRPNWTRVPT